MGVYLSKARTEKDSQDGGEFDKTTTRFGLTAMQGWRQFMEDAHVAFPEIKSKAVPNRTLAVYGVFDGHGGPAVSAWVSRHFEEHFKRCLAQQRSLHDEGRLKPKVEGMAVDSVIVCEALQQTFLALDEAMQEDAQREELSRIRESAEEEKRLATEEDENLSLLNALLSGEGPQPRLRVIEKDGQKYFQLLPPGEIFDRGDEMDTDADADENWEWEGPGPGVSERFEDVTEGQNPQSTSDSGSESQQQDIELEPQSDEASGSESAATKATDGANSSEGNKSCSIPASAGSQSSGTDEPDTSQTSPASGTSGADSGGASASSEVKEAIMSDVEGATATSDSSAENGDTSTASDKVADRSSDLEVEDISTSTAGATSDSSEEGTLLNNQEDTSTSDVSDSAWDPHASESGEETKREADLSGSTAVVAVVISGDPSMVVIANAGDSRIVLCRNGVAVPLSQDHKPGLSYELSRIRNAGGKVVHGRVDGNLNLSRSLGDLLYKKNTALPPEAQRISAFPDVRWTEIHEDDEFLLLACDGIWDCMSNQQAVDFIRERLPKDDNPATAKQLSAICEEMCDVCLAETPLTSEGGIGCDNMTVVVVQLGPSLRKKHAETHQNSVVRFYGEEPVHVPSPDDADVNGVQCFLGAEE